MKVLVTGAAGRLGTTVIRILCQAGHQVRATDRVIRPNSPVKIEPADLLNIFSCYPLVEDCDVLVHLGNHPGTTSLGGDLIRIYAENCTMTGNMMQVAADCGVKKIIYASSVQAFTAGRERAEPLPPSQLPYLPVDGLVPSNPGNPYALSKQAGENLLRYLACHQKLSGIAIRFPYLMNDESFTYCQQHPFQRYVRLDEVFSYLHLDDAAELLNAIILADLPGYRCYFPVGPGNVTARPVPELVHEYYPNVPLRRPLEQMDTLVDISAITRETGWVPRRSLLNP